MNDAATDHFQAAADLLLRLESDFYDEGARAELSAVRADLTRLLDAARLAAGANKLLGRPPQAARLEGRAAAARTALAGMEGRAELRERDGRLCVAWGRTEAVDARAVAALRDRADLFLRLAASETASGEAAGPAPECSR